MNIKKVLEIIEDFKKFGTKGIIKEYPKEEIRVVLPEIAEIDREADWYKKLLKYLYEKDKKWWHDPLLVGIVSSIIGAMAGAFITYFIRR